MGYDYNKTVLYVEPQSTTAHLHVIDARGTVSVYPIYECLTIGRADSGRRSDCMIQCSWVSGVHGRIFKSGDSFVYEDLNSTNGTYINDTHYGKNGERMRVLHHGDVIRIGNSKNVASGKEPAILLFRMDDCSQEQWQSIALPQVQGEICLGRNNMGGNNPDMTVSRRHAVFFKSNNRWAIKDFGSLNGVFLNNRKLEQAVYLYYGDCVRLSEHYFINLGYVLLFNVKQYWQSGQQQYYNQQQYNAYGGQQYYQQGGYYDQQQYGHGYQQNIGPSLCIYIEERTVFQRFKKLTLLKDIQMTIDNGEMVLILGGSGAGKTTFMNAVMGYEKAKGTILHGERDLYSDYEAVKYNIGFVPQQDLLRAADTVEETLRNAAEMKMPASANMATREARVNEVMEMLGLTRERASQVQKLSGGQKKRLSIAVELISNPSLFFLDEPDSGLDGIMARSLMENLRTIANQGKIVMIITHGPDRAADLFDKVVVLAKSEQDNIGHLAFYGSVQQAFQFFDCQSLEGVVRRINRRDEGGDGLSDYYIQKFAQTRR